MIAFSVEASCQEEKLSELTRLLLLHKCVNATRKLLRIDAAVVALFDDFSAKLDSDHIHFIHLL
jgi:hypothetical protein